MLRHAIPPHDREAAYRFVVGTPAGFERVLDNEHLPSFYIDDRVIVVSRWNLSAIFNMVTEKIIKLYHELANSM
jgi:hypothetical protein